MMHRSDKEYGSYSAPMTMAGDASRSRRAAQIPPTAAASSPDASDAATPEQTPDAAAQNATDRHPTPHSHHRNSNSNPPPPLGQDNRELGNRELGNRELGNRELSNGNSGHGKSGNGKSGNGKSGNGKSGNGKTGDRPAVVSPAAAAAEAVPSDRGLLPVLKNGNFLALWSGQVFSQLADKVYLVLMIMIITSQFQTAGQTVSGWVSAVMVAFTIPAVLFGSIAGVFVDYWQKKQVLVLTNLLRGGFVLAIPLLLGLVQPAWAIAHIPLGFIVLLGITFLVSTLTQFFAPAEQAVIPLVVERRHLLSANSLYTTTMMASVIVGFAIGEPLLAFADRAIAPYAGVADIGKELLVGSSYALAGVILLGVQTREARRSASATARQTSVWQDIQDGLRYLQRNREVRAALIQLIVLFSIFAALAVLAVRLAEVMPSITSSQFGFLLAAGGVGMGLGALIVGLLGHHVSRDRLSLFGALGFGLSLTALSLFTQQLLPTLLILVALGANAAIVGVPLQTTIQEQTPEAMRGKVFGLQNNAVNIALSLPLALAGIAEAALGLQLVLLSLGGVAIATGIFTWSLGRYKDAHPKLEGLKK